ANCPLTPPSLDQHIPVAQILGGASQEIPAVARFDHMRGIPGPGVRPLLGFRCTAGWCVIGVESAIQVTLPDHQSASIPAPGDDPLPTGKPRWLRHGWFDEQDLAVPLSSTSLQPQMRSSIVPSERLGNMYIPQFEKSWQLVARVHLRSAPNPKYA